MSSRTSKVSKKKPNASKEKKSKDIKLKNDADLNISDIEILSESLDNETESERYTYITPIKKHNSNDVYKELINKQLSNVPSEWKLTIGDMKRICKYIGSSIFDSEECCIWTGYVTNANNSTKGTYVNFYFKNRKVALHRLLYSNFVKPLNTREYLKCNCENKGICCNLNHYKKYRYTKNQLTEKKRKTNKLSKVKNDISIVTCDENELILDFN